MYSLGIKDSFVAQHSLTVEASEYEKTKHSHHYQIELEFKSSRLGKEGYLLDIDDAKESFSSVSAIFAIST